MRRATGTDRPFPTTSPRRSSGPATTRRWSPTSSSRPLAGDEVVSHLVHQETTFDHDAVRRHITVLALTTLAAGHRPRRRPRRARATRPRGVATATHRERPAERRPRRHVTHVVAAARRPTSPGPSAASSPLTLGWGAVSRLDLMPATCGDPDCEADHGYEGTSPPTTSRLRISADADGEAALRPGHRLRPGALGDASAAARRTRPLPGLRRLPAADAPDAGPAWSARPRLAVACCPRSPRRLGVRRVCRSTHARAARRRAARWSCLVDGLGYDLLRQRSGHAPFLRCLLPAAHRLAAGFPSTTATQHGHVRHRPAAGRATGWSATRCSSPARTGCSTSCPGRTVPTPGAWQPQRDRLRAVAAGDGVPVTRSVRASSTGRA